MHFRTQLYISVFNNHILIVLISVKYHRNDDYVKSDVFLI